MNSESHTAVPTAPTIFLLLTLIVIPLVGDDLKALTTRSMMGDSTAQADLGLMYWEGTEVQKNYAEAFKWIEKSAIQGNPEGQRRLGILYHEGHGVIQDFEASSIWIKKSAEQGDSGASRFLGDFYRNGIGVERDLVHAYAWYLVAVSLGDEQAAKERDSLVSPIFGAPLISDANISAGQALAKKLSTEISNRKVGSTVIRQESREWTKQVVADLRLKLDGVPEKVRLSSVIPEFQKAGINYQAHIVETADPQCRITISRTTFRTVVTAELLEESMNGLVGPGTSFSREDYAIYRVDARVAGQDGIKFNLKKRADFDAPFATFEFFVFSKGNSFWVINFCYKEQSTYHSDFAENILKDASVVE
jgi:hypothetical protein